MIKILIISLHGYLPKWYFFYFTLKQELHKAKPNFFPGRFSPDLMFSVPITLYPSHGSIILSQRGKPDKLQNQENLFWCARRFSLYSQNSLTLFPSRSKCVKFSVILYCSGAAICHTQFLLGGYSSGNDGLCKVPLAWSI